MSADFLKNYQYSPGAIHDGVRFELDRGGVVYLKPYDSKQFWESYFNKRKEVDGGNDESLISKDDDVSCVNWAIAEAVLISIGEGDDRIDDTQQKYEILCNDEYYAFTQEVIVKAKNYNNFLSQSEEDIKK